jgi:hypothetical protein
VKSRTKDTYRLPEREHVRKGSTYKMEKVYRKEVRYESGRRTEVAQDRAQWRYGATGFVPPLM